MPPIRLHKDDPIKPTTGAQVPTESTPETANPPPTRTTPYFQPASTTAPAYDSSNPPPPQPGARPIPPTSSYAPEPTGSSPAPPQPGATPGSTTGTEREGYTATHITTVTQGPPPQFSIPPPTDSQLAGRSTTTATTPQSHTPGPTTLNLGPAPSPYQPAHTGGAIPEAQPRSSLEHPPGYVQAPDHVVGGGGIPGGQQERHREGGSGETAGGVGETAWNLLSKAGEALKKGEEAAWKAVRNK